MYVFSNGQVVVGRWERNLAVGPIRLVDADGEPILLTPGNTWVELAENTGGDAFTGLPVDLTTLDPEAPPTTIEYPRIVLDEPEAAPTEILIAFAEPSDDELTRRLEHHPTTADHRLAVVVAVTPV